MCLGSWGSFCGGLCLGVPILPSVGSSGAFFGLLTRYLKLGILSGILNHDFPLLSFYREDTGDKLPTPDELRLALQQAISDRQQLAVQLEQERDRAERLANRLRELGENPEAL